MSAAVRAFVSVLDVVLGKPIPTSDDEEERVGPVRGVAVLGLDALASAAYGPEALLTVLIPLGLGGIHFLQPLTLAIVGILLAVFVSYRQTIGAYPSGGGSYTVARENLGEGASLVAAAALSLDYLLNVAVAISAGVGAVVSAVPSLQHETLALCLGILILLTIVNLRGVRSSGALFAIPTYLFVTGMLVVLGLGIARAIAHGGHPPPVVAPPAMKPSAVAVSAWLLLRAFANGCTAMTGVEAVSNGVPIFRDPAVGGARRTLTAIVLLLVVFLLGVAFLSRAYGVGAMDQNQPGYQSVLSQLGAAVLGRGPLYVVYMASVFAVLALSANTSFADFPRLARLLARDRYLPESFEHRGRRLAFSYGVSLLAALSGVLLTVFGGVTDGLIPLFAIGALLAFTMSQAGMVGHWVKLHVYGPRLWVNAFGAAATGVTTLLVLASKFVEGAWISAVLIGLFIVLLAAVRRYSDRLERALRTDESLELGPLHPTVAVVPLRRWDHVSLKALRFAIGFAPEVIGVQVLTGDREDDDLTERWKSLVVEPTQRLRVAEPRLVVLRSEYRRMLTPLLDFVIDLASRESNRHVVVVVPELVERRWYDVLLHNHSTVLLKTLLLLRGGPRVAVMSTPWYLSEWLPPRKRTSRLPIRFRRST